MKVTAAVARSLEAPFTVEELELDEPQADQATGECIKVVLVP